MIKTDKNGYLSRLVALPETNSKLAPQNGWKLEDAISFQTCPIFRGKLAVSFRECNSETKKNHQIRNSPTWFLLKFVVAEKEMARWWE